MESNVFALWLPLNKDFFGFDNYWDAPLNIFSEINKTYYIEHPILLRSKEIIEKISFEDYPFNYMYHKKYDNNTTVRNISFQIKKGQQDTGIFTIFSHGLYIWEFNEKTSTDDFLKHLEVLFHTTNLSKGETDKKSSKKNQDFLKNYEGILNYFQLELLLDILYNIYIAPSVFFKTNEHNVDMYKKIEEKFSLYNILYSLILVKNEGNLQPLSKRDNYPLNSTKTDDKINYLSGTMEHFIRVANTFSLEHYRRGLHYCLKNLTEIGIIRTDIFEEGVNYNFPSIMDHKSSMMRLESYHGMMYEKLPNLKYLNTLFIGLQKVYLPKEQSYKENPTLIQAIEQYSRRIETISNFFYSIEKLIEEENTKNIHYEIAELRKNNEINNQLAMDNKEVQKEEMSDVIQTILKQTLEDNSTSLNKGVYLLTIVTVEIALLTPIITNDKINTFLDIYNNLSKLNPYSKAILVLLLLIGLYMILPKKIKNIFSIFMNSTYLKDTNIKNNNYEIIANNKNQEKSLYIFDNSNIDIRNQNDGIYTKLIEYFHSENSIISIHNMPSLLNMEEKIKCIKYNTIRERYRSYKLYKFTFVSDYNKNKKIKYTIDIDIQYDTIGVNDTKINNIRIAIIDEYKLNKNDLETVYKNMKKLKDKLSINLYYKFKNNKKSKNY